MEAAELALKELAYDRIQLTLGHMWPYPSSASSVQRRLLGNYPKSSFNLLLIRCVCNAERSAVRNGPMEKSSAVHNSLAISCTERPCTRRRPILAASTVARLGAAPTVKIRQ